MCVFLCFQWKGQQFPLLVFPESTVGSIKLQLAVLTTVQVGYTSQSKRMNLSDTHLVKTKTQAKRQKLVGISSKEKGIKVNDETLIESVNIKKNTIMLIGNPEAEVFVDFDEKVCIEFCV